MTEFDREQLNGMPVPGNPAPDIINPQSPPESPVSAPPAEEPMQEPPGIQSPDPGREEPKTPPPEIPPAEACMGLRLASGIADCRVRLPWGST